MLTVAIIVLAITLIAGAAINGRLFVYRHDQKWRRERGALFGDWPLAHGWDNIYRKGDYAPEGHHLIPLAISLTILSMAVFAVTFVLLVKRFGA